MGERTEHEIKGANVLCSPAIKGISDSLSGL